MLGLNSRTAYPIQYKRKSNETDVKTNQLYLTSDAFREYLHFYNSRNNYDVDFNMR